MKNIELKNCPNCKERIGKHDIECPYCKYIDDPKYQKHNSKITKNKKRRKKKDIYKPILIIPIICYLIYMLFNINSLVIILSLVLLNFMCFVVKKDWIFGVILIEVITLIFNFITNIKDNFKLEIIALLLGIVFIIIPKVMYIIKSNKKKVKKKK